KLSKEPCKLLRARDGALGPHHTAAGRGRKNINRNFSSSFSFPCQLRKPLIERKRRERINNCLDQLKETVVGAFHLDVSQSKLEKADILEMTVKHLQNIQSSKLMADSKVGLEAQQRYSTGYIQCMHEVHNLLLTCEWMDKTLGARLLNHLLKSLPRSGEDTCKAALRSSSPSQQPLPTPKSPLSPKGSTRGTNPSQEPYLPNLT
uniref:Hes family bHLH transcription factor 6 n=1 Tax=Athene cunicularia TaxID=194338 RepID=A0A663LLF3_ATHCN